MHFHKTESTGAYAKICESNLYLPNYIEEREQYLNWLWKFGVFGSSKESEGFLSKLKVKN